MDLNAKKNFLIDFSFTVIVCGLGFIIGRFTLEYLTPFVLAAFIAYFMQKPASVLEKKTSIPKEICALVLAAGVYILAVVLVVFFIYRIVAMSGGMIDALPGAFSYISDISAKAEEKISYFFEGLPENTANEITAVLRESISGLAANVTKYVSQAAASAVKGIPSFLFSGVVALVASCYIAKDYDRLREFLKGICGNRIYGNLVKIKLILSASVFKLLKGYLILAAITYAELIIGFLILGIKYAPLIAFIVAIVDLLPVLGTGTVLLPWGIILLISSDSFSGFGMIALYVVITLVRNFAEPKIIGSQIGINPLFTLLAMFAGLKLFGFVGLILLPITLIVTIEYYRKEINADKM